MAAAPSREYVYSGSALLARIDSTGTNYYHQDQLSNRLVTNGSGATVGQQGHYPFGESWYNTSGGKLLFTTYERDGESGNDYAMARSYVNRLGRFSSPDPLGGSIENPQSLNRYAYTQNDPINSTDPSGMNRVPHCLDDGFTCGAGGGGGGDGVHLFYLGGGSSFGSGGPRCTADGVDTPCGIVISLLQMGAAFQCPGNSCAGLQQIDGKLYKYGWGIVGAISNNVTGCSAGANGQTQCAGSISLTTAQGWVLQEVASGGSLFQDLPHSAASLLNELKEFLLRTPITITFGQALIPLGELPVGIGPTVSFSIIAKSKTVCISPGAGVMTAGKSANLGVLMIGNLDGARDILRGFGTSINLQANPFAGYEMVSNRSGNLGGPTVGTPGVSYTATYGFCKN